MYEEIVGKAEVLRHAVQSCGTKPLAEVAKEEKSNCLHSFSSGGADCRGNHLLPDGAAVLLVAKRDIYT